MAENDKEIEMKILLDEDSFKEVREKIKILSIPTLKGGEFL